MTVATMDEQFHVPLLSLLRSSSYGVLKGPERFAAVPTVGHNGPAVSGGYDMHVFARHD